MSEIVRAEGNTLSNKIQYAQAMAGSSLLPRQYQKQPANLLFALEYAEALGVSPIHAITSIHVIEGKPSASADLIASLVRKAGHKLRVTSDAKTCTAVLIRQDDPDFEFTATWTMAQASTAGLTGKGVWKSYPSAMLRARAITEVCRMGAPDALYGVIYTPEELGADVNEEGSPVDLGEQAPPAQQQGKRKPATLAQAMAKNAPEPEAELVDDPPARDFLKEAEMAGGDIDNIKAIYYAAQQAGATPEVLADIYNLAAPVTADENPAAA